MKTHNKVKKVKLQFAVSHNIVKAKYRIKANLKKGNTTQNVFDHLQNVKNLVENRQIITLSQKIQIQFSIQAKQELIITLYDAQNKLVAVVDPPVYKSEIFGTRRMGIKRQFKNGSKTFGSIVIAYDEMDQESSAVSMMIAVQNIQTRNKFIFCCPDDYYFQINKKRQNNTVNVFRSQKIQQIQRTPIELKLTKQELCDDDNDHPITITFINQSSRSIIGNAAFSITNLRDKQSSFAIEDQKTIKGQVTINQFKQKQRYNFLDFHTNGMQICLSIGVDFTQSNYHYTKPNSLHYFKGNTQSYYELALRQTVPPLLSYDDDKMVPMYGFGAIVQNLNNLTTQNVSYFFPMNGNLQNASVKQLDGILQNYRNCLPHLTLSGPTYIAPIIKLHLDQSRELKKDKKGYIVLMILTDGDCDDYEDVVDLIVQCGRLPISIVIIGITNDTTQKWDLMHKIDDNNRELVSSNGKRSQRDLVKFVEYMKFRSNLDELAEQVLSQFPKQVEDYHMLQHINPKMYNHNLDDADRGIIQDQFQINSKTGVNSRTPRKGEANPEINKEQMKKNKKQNKNKKQQVKQQIRQQSQANLDGLEQSHIKLQERKETEIKERVKLYQDQ